MSHSRRTSLQASANGNDVFVQCLLLPVVLRALHVAVKQMLREIWYGSISKQHVQPIQFSLTSNSFYHHFQ
jgi:hypothetical protein